MYSLLQRTREDVNALWKSVNKYNETTQPAADAPRVTFYFGQNVTRSEGGQSTGSEASS